MARLNAAPMGAMCVGLGAYAARATVPRPLGMRTWGRLTLAMILTVLVTCSSMLINDYHDFKNGVDTIENKPGRPLVTGQVKLESVKIVLNRVYALHLTLMCLVDSQIMRLWVLGNTLLTYFYSVHLKPVTGVKNLTCALIVSMAFSLGSLALGGGLASLASACRPSLAILGLIWHREIVMDVKDFEGDCAAGVRTLPVVFGRRRALGLAMLPLAIAAAAAGWFQPGSVGTARFLGAVMPHAAQACLSLNAMARGFDSNSLKCAIELAPFLLLMSLILVIA
jgi:geranylgeranylglycerol-phosphate geranylgeranyltransferase